MHAPSVRVWVGTVCVFVTLTPLMPSIDGDAIVKLNFLFINDSRSIELNGIFVAPHDIQSANKWKAMGKNHRH